MKFKRGTCALTSRIRKNICPMSKRAQVTIFIIIAVIIVALGVTIYFLYPKIQSAIGRGAKNPEAFIQECLEDELEDVVELISLQGGSVEPNLNFTYKDIPIQYLCYTKSDRSPCKTQIPFLKENIEQEVKEEIEDEVRACFNSLEESYLKQGYNVNLQEGSVPVKVELLPQRVVTTIDYSLTLSKAEAEEYDSFNVVLNNNLYELVAIAQNILNKAANPEGADCNYYMENYQNIKCEILVKNTEATIYKLTSKNTGDVFQLAIRSLVLGGLLE